MTGATRRQECHLELVPASHKTHATNSTKGTSGKVIVPGNDGCMARMPLFEASHVLAEELEAGQRNMRHASQLFSLDLDDNKKAVSILAPREPDALAHTRSARLHARVPTSVLEKCGW